MANNNGYWIQWTMDSIYIYIYIYFIENLRNINFNICTSYYKNILFYRSHILIFPLKILTNRVLEEELFYKMYCNYICVVFNYYTIIIFCSNF